MVIANLLSKLHCLNIQNLKVIAHMVVCLGSPTVRPLVL